MEENSHIPTIEIVFVDYNCADGCCYDYWHELVIDGEVVVKNIDAISHSEFVSLILTYFDIKHNIYG